MKQFFIDLYTNITSTTLGTLVFAVLFIATGFILGLIPYFIYMGNSKYFGDANNTYDWMPILSICIVAAEVVGGIGYGFYNTLKK